MAHQDDPGPGLAGGVGEQGVARGAGGGGQAGRGFVALPAQRPEVPADPLGDPLALLGPARAGGVQAVIDRQDQQPPAMRPGPFIGQQQQGQAVPAAREGHGQRGLG